MSIVRIIAVLLISFLILGCTGKLEREIKYTKDYARSEVSKLQANQQSINSGLRQMHSETEQELSLTRERLNRIEQMLNYLNSNVTSIKQKTDQFDVQRSNNSLLFVPAR